jgi:hypothetical protein
MAVEHYLARRGNWQLIAHQGGTRAELDTAQVIRGYLDKTYPGIYDVKSHPTDLSRIYYEYTYDLDPSMYAKPATPTSDDVWLDTASGEFRTLGKNGKEVESSGGGCIPDIRIMHMKTRRKCFIECKNQGDAGNAHERAAKYATPSIISYVQKKFGMDYHPFGHLFTGQMVEKRKYQVELATTYGFAPNHLFLWKKDRPVEPLIEWLEKVLLPQLAPAPTPCTATLPC